MNHDDEKLFINLLEKRKIYWEPLIASGVILIAIFGVMVPLFMKTSGNTTSLVLVDESSLLF
jgi:hypothetical protein